jgi:Tfp pilus assembly protein PilO
MKFNIEDYLYQIDQSMAEKEDREVYMLYFVVAGALIFLSYYFLWDSAELGYKKALKQRTVLEQKIRKDKAYLASHPATMIVQIENQTKGLETQFKQFQDSNAYIKYQIEQISSLYYDEQAWGEYVDSIAYNAKKYGIKLQEYSNTFTDNKDAFGHVLDINVKASGGYQNMLKYINSLEQSFLVVDLHDFDLSSKDSLYSDLHISVWGITY